jgi:succinate dehydrogenase/fumarate reductase flavoprotein subunit
MTSRSARAENISTGSSSIEFEADVLVLGGGPAGTWAAISAAERGARVVLADKGFCGTSGATAAAGTGVWYVDPDPAKREAAMANREPMGGYLQDRSWMARVLDRTYQNSNRIAEWGYPYPTDGSGKKQLNSLQGPEYMRLMRKRTKQASVTILDHSPALELLVDDEGVVAGARGIRRQKQDDWIVRAKAVVIATGGCAFLSKTLGSNVLTGDGYLMAAEVGADFTSMEFSNPYAISTAFGTVTKTLFYGWATFTYEDGSVVPGAASKGGRSAIARALTEGPVYAQLDKADAPTRAAMRLAQPNFFLPLDRTGIDPFTQRFPVTLRLEGTVRGTGGLRITDETCATSAPGLYAAGDAATRELICGGFTGGGSHNAAWAMSSGYWAGGGAADYALRSGRRQGRSFSPAGTAGLRSGNKRAFDPAALAKAVQDEVFPYHINYFREAGRLDASLRRLDRLWRDVSDAGAADGDNAFRARESAAMLATARWMYRSALARTETRGMHRREDFPQQDERQRHYVTTGGLDDIWTSTRPKAGATLSEAAE